MTEQTSVQDLLHRIEHLTSVYRFALSPHGNPSIMISYLNRKGFSLASLPEGKSIDPLVCHLFKETIANELDYLFTEAKKAARQEIVSLNCAPN